MSSDLVPSSIWSFPSMRFSSLMDDDSWLKQSGIPSGLSITEDDTNIYVDAALPGVRPEDIDMSYHQGILRISGETKEGEKKDRKSYKRMASSFSYQVAVPGEIDPNAEPEATCNDGVVTVSFTKQNAVLPKKISLKMKTSGGSRSKRSEEKVEAKAEEKEPEKEIEETAPIEETLPGVSESSETAILE